MKKKLTTVAFKGTEEQHKKLLAVIDEYKGKDGNLLPVLQKAQEIYGYLPTEVQKEIALGLDVPGAEIFGVASFYAQFKLNPEGEIAIGV